MNQSWSGMTSNQNFEVKTGGGGYVDGWVSPATTLTVGPGYEVYNPH